MQARCEAKEREKIVRIERGSGEFKEKGRSSLPFLVNERQSH